MKEKNMTIWKALIPIVFLMVALFTNITYGNGESLLPLIFTAIVAAVVALLSGFKWEELEKGILDSIGITLQSFLILMIIGMIIGSWILAGIVPTIIYYGLKILSPNIFLVASTILCAIVSLATGSSWTTVGTIGVALIGIGQGLGVPMQITAGSIISGAYFGDKMSPLSETTNMASAVVGVNIYEHIQHMFFTTIPALIISLILFAIVGMRYSGAALDTSQIDIILLGIQDQFTISPILLLVPLLVIILVIKKVPAIPGLIIGFLAGGLAAMIFQGSNIVDIMTAAQFGYLSETGVEVIDALLSKGGLDGMMYTISLIICAMTVGGILEKSGMLQTIVDKLSSFVKKDGSLVATSVLTAVGINIVTGDQSLAIILPGRMFSKSYEDAGLKPKNLSRACEDGGTVTSPLVPWNVCGAFMATTLGVSTWLYLPFCFFNLLSPLVSMVLGFTGWSLEKYDIEEKSKTSRVIGGVQ